MKRFVIERDIEGVNRLNVEQLRAAAAQSNAALAKLAGKVQWIHSYVVPDKTFCIYLAESEQLVHEPLEAVCGKLLDQVRQDGNPMRAIISSVDDVWQISVLKFAVDMIGKSKGINLFDFKRRGLL